MLMQLLSFQIVSVLTIILLISHICVVLHTLCENVTSSHEQHLSHQQIVSDSLQTSYQL